MATVIPRILSAGMAAKYYKCQATWLKWHAAIFTGCSVILKDLNGAKPTRRNMKKHLKKVAASCCNLFSLYKVPGAAAHSRSRSQWWASSTTWRLRWSTFAERRGVAETSNSFGEGTMVSAWWPGSPVVDCSNRRTINKQNKETT